MSYLIQNFSIYRPYIRLNNSSFTAFLSKNIWLIYSYMRISYPTLLLCSLPLTYSTDMFIKFSHFFDNFVTSILLKPQFLRYAPLGTNFPSTSYHRALADLDLLFSNEVPALRFEVNTVYNFKYPYFSRPRIAITSVTQNEYLAIIYKFFYMTVNVWFLWPKSYSFYSNFTDISHNWVLIKFVTKYFFKVYSI